MPLLLPGGSSMEDVLCGRAAQSLECKREGSTPSQEVDGDHVFSR